MQDRELIEHVLSGQREAYGTLMERYQRAIFALCRRMTGNDLDAEDLTHEAFVEAYVKLRQLRDPDRFGGWLRTLALNVCRMWFRQRLRASDALADYKVLDGREPEDADDVRAQLTLALNRLSAPHRMLLVLHYLEGLSYADMATFLDVPIGTIMSRLHRARQALKNVMEEMTEEEVPMVTEDRIRQEVDAEITLLLDMFREQPNAMERLSVILQQSPARFRELLRQVDDEVKTERLARLLPRLGVSGVQTILQACFSNDEPERTHARAVLCRAVVCDASNRPGTSGWTKMPSRFAYMLADTLIASPVNPEAKAALLVDLMAACPDESNTLLLTNVLMTFPDAAFTTLLERLWASSTEAKPAPSCVLHTLTRTGARFCRAILDALDDSSEARREVALKGLESVARSLDPPWLEGTTPQQWAEEVRTRAKWAPLKRSDVDQSVLAALIEKTAAFLHHPSDTIRETAIRVLGRLHSREHATVLHECLRHERPSTRVSAIHALAEIGDQSHADAIIAAVQDSEPMVRRAASEALGRMQVQRAFPVLKERIGDQDAAVRLAALNALAELDTEEAQAEVRLALRSQDQEMRRAAAILLCEPRRRPGPSELTQERLERFGLAGSPMTDISVSAAIRWAMPEIRAYEHADLTQRIAQVCSDYSATRRYLIEIGLMERDNGTYELTEFGRTVWRVEHYIREHYLGV